MYDKEPEMTIERNGEQIQLTEKELRKAYYTYQTILDREDIVMGLEFAKEHGTLSDGEIDETIDKNNLLKKYDITNNEEVISELISEYRYASDENASEWEKYRHAAIERLVFHLEQLDDAIEKIHNGEAYYSRRGEQLITGEKGTDTLIVYDLSPEAAKRISIEAAKKGNAWADNLPNAPKKVYENPTKKELLKLFNLNSGWLSTEEYHKEIVLFELRMEKNKKQQGR